MRRLPQLFLFLALVLPVILPAQKRTVLSEEQRINFEKYFFNGAREKIAGNLDESMRQFKSCILIDPYNDAVYFNLAELCLNKKFYPEAKDYINRALQLDKENLWYHKLLVNILEANADYVGAAKECVWLSTKEDKVQHLIEASMYYERGQEFSKAIAVLNLAEKETGINEEISMRKEQNYLAQNKFSKAVDEINRLSKAFPGMIRYRVLLAELYLVNGKTKEGLALYQAILKEDPANGFAAFALGDYYHSQGDDSKWLTMMIIGIQSKDVDIKSKLRMLVTFISARPFGSDTARFSRATMELADHFVSTHPEEPSTYLFRGDLFIEQLEFAKAHHEYEEALRLDPSILVAYQQMLLCSSRLGNNELILTDCIRGIEAFPNEPTFHIYRTLALMQLKRYQEAVDGARAGIGIAGDDKNLRYQFLVTMGDAYHYLKNNIASDSVYDQAIQLDSNNSYGLNNYAYFLSLQKKQLDRAERMSKKSIELDPGNASYYDTYGWILFQLKRYSEAADFVGKSLEIEPENQEVIEHMGDILWFQNKPEKALQYWKRASEQGGQSDTLQRKIKDQKWYE